MDACGEYGNLFSPQGTTLQKYSGFVKVGQILVGSKCSGHDAWMLWMKHLALIVLDFVQVAIQKFFDGFLLSINCAKSGNFVQALSLSLYLLSLTLRRAPGVSSMSISSHVEAERITQHKLLRRSVSVLEFFDWNFYSFEGTSLRQQYVVPSAIKVRHSHGLVTP